MQKPSASTIIPIVIIASIILGGLSFLFKPQDDSIRQANQQDPLIADEQLTTPKVTTPPESQTGQDPEENQGSHRRAPMEATITDPCLDAIKQLDSFFLYLDSQDYIKEYQFPTGSKDFVSSMINKALSHPPNHNTEIKITNKVKTGAHLYRTLGGQNLIILSQILQNEPDQLETVFANFYDWSLMTGQCSSRTYAIRPQLDKLYNYALFFIDSEDGKSYINRRDTMTGLLTRFYAVQIITDAGTHHIDTNNTDLSTHITSLITDIESTNMLEKKATYLKTLYIYRDN